MEIWIENCCLIDIQKMFDKKRRKKNNNLKGKNNERRRATIAANEKFLSKPNNAGIIIPLDYFETVHAPTYSFNW